MKSGTSHSGKIDILVKANRLLEAIDYVRQHDSSHQCGAMVEECGANYRYMLEYFGRCTSGYQDSSRAAIIAQIKETLRRAADCLDVAETSSTAEGLFYAALRTRRYLPDRDVASCVERVSQAASHLDLALEADAEDPQLRPSLENAADALFTCVWTTLHLTQCEANILENMADDDSRSLYAAKALVISALLLSSLKYYDYRKLRLLFTIALANADRRLAARALASALLICSKYPARIAEDRKTMELAEAVSDRKELASAVRKFVPAMLRTIDTDRVNRRVKEDILPELMRMKPDIEQRMKRLGEKSDLYDLDENPDWEEFLSKSGIESKLKEITEMQMDGADVFMSAFAQMKGFAFFRRMSNWLLPFDLCHSELRGVRGVVPEAMLHILAGGNYFCASDKYSMLLAMAKMPAAQFQMMSGHLSEQMQDLSEEARGALGITVTDMATEMALYLKDLYRFFRLKNDDGTDPFGSMFEIPDIAPYSRLRHDEELQRGIAEFYFKYGYWQQAFDAFATVRTLSDDAMEDVLQKQGYCLQLLGRYEEALTLYRQAELLNPDSDWLLKRIASLLRDMKRYEEAADYARRALERKPDNLHLEMMLGTILMLGGNASDALKSFYKIKYLKPENTKVLRPIAWCEFLLGHYDKSVQQYDSLEEITPEDMLNCGHALFAKGDVSAASERYRRCRDGLNGGDEEFRSLMAEDSAYLRQAGVEELAIALMADLVSTPVFS